MTEDAVSLWLPGRGDGSPECLLGRPLLVPARGEGFFELLSSSLWTPFTWGDSVRAVPHPEGGFAVTGLGAAGPHVRLVLAYAPTVPSLTARRVAHDWLSLGARAVEAVPGIVVVAWDERMAASIDEVLARGDVEWSVIERWASHERTPASVDVVMAPRDVRDEPR
ncbi:hypothetical protein [Mobilicoccus sp.]|uniref:hypothetical protein n=1 Tax=Mobilicoccus sp. TaxID=2034349 RepID=UPI00289BD9B1|nr:hypothetical protein [Mobilicoccus sp.]